VLQQSPKPAGEDQRFGPEGLHLVSISAHLLRFGIAWGRVLFSRLVLSSWALRNHQLYLERFLFW
jgi:hypothetical protein